MKPKSEADRATSTKPPRKEDLELARETYTLAVLVHGELVAARGWAAVPPRSLSFEAPLPGALPNAWSFPAVWPCFP